MDMNQNAHATQQWGGDSHFLSSIPQPEQYRIWVQMWPSGAGRRDPRRTLVPAHAGESSETAEGPTRTSHFLFRSCLQPWAVPGRGNGRTIAARTWAVGVNFPAREPSSGGKCLRSVPCTLSLLSPSQRRHGSGEFPAGELKGSLGQGWTPGLTSMGQDGKGRAWEHSPAWGFTAPLEGS